MSQSIAGESRGGRIEWWREAVFYQICPRSFMDADGDGVGDLKGIIDRLDYLGAGTSQSLGIDAIWLTPMFPSPLWDFGYDVADYCEVHRDYGDLAILDRLLRECHQRGIRVLLDLVANHTSSKHPWFIESASSRHNAKRDWYYWREARYDGSLPNNWASPFGGPAWEYHPSTGQYYLHTFTPQQPDLNWHNPHVVAAMGDIKRFWLARGVDGFRIDALGTIMKHPTLEDNPPNPDYDSSLPLRYRTLAVNSINFPGSISVISDFRAVMDEYPNAVAVAQGSWLAEDLARFYGSSETSGVHLVYGSHLIKHGRRLLPWDSQLIASTIEKVECTLPKWAQPCFSLGNHDCPRFVSRHNTDGRGADRAKAAALLLLSLRGTPFIYYGDEIGMVDVALSEEMQTDPARFEQTGRDPARTPMQWTDEDGRGFTTGNPWLPFGPKGISVASQTHDRDSLLSLYRDALRIRRAEPALRSGAFEWLSSKSDVVLFQRSAPDTRPVVCAMNTTSGAVSVRIPARFSTVLIATERTLDRTAVSECVDLPPLGAVWLA